jgi:hypothetical protein
MKAYHGKISVKKKYLARTNLSSSVSKRDEARQTIYEDALSVEVRSDWHAPGSDDNDRQAGPGSSAHMEDADRRAARARLALR